MSGPCGITREIRAQAPHVLISRSEMDFWLFVGHCALQCDRVVHGKRLPRAIRCPETRFLLSGYGLLVCRCLCPLYISCNPIPPAACDALTCSPRVVRIGEMMEVVWNSRQSDCVAGFVRMLQDGHSPRGHAYGCRCATRGYYDGRFDQSTVRG